MRSAEFAAGANAGGRTIIPAPGESNPSGDDDQKTSSELFEALLHEQGH